MVGDGLRLAAPLEMRAEANVWRKSISRTERRSLSGTKPSQTAEDFFRATRGQRATGRANKQSLAPREKRLALLAVMPKCANRGGVQGNHTFRAKLAPAVYGPYLPPRRSRPHRRSASPRRIPVDASSPISVS